MAHARRIGVLTGGGDVPGLNAVIKSIVHHATPLGYQVLGIRRGWEGMTHLRQGSELDPNYILPLDYVNTRTIDRTGGTMLHTSRVNPRKMRAGSLPKHIPEEKLTAMQVGEGLYNFTPVVLDNIAHLALDYLIPIGGDDTLSFAATLDAQGVSLIGVPKTMDNDVQGTEYCIGFSTAVTRARDAINRQRTILGSHERIGIFRVFGRDAGFTAVYAAYVTGGRCVIPEIEFDLERLIELLLEDKRNNSSRYAFVIASEGALWKGQSLSEWGEADAYGHKKKADIGLALAEEIRRHTGEDTISSDLTYELRGGEPDLVDYLAGTTFGNIAVDLIRQGIRGRLVAIQSGKYTHAALPDPKIPPRSVDVARMYNVERCRPEYTGKIGLPLMLTSVEP